MVGGIGEAGEFLRDDNQHGPVGAPEAVYRYRQAHTTHSVIFGQVQETVWNCGPWTSDAKFLYFCVRDQRVDHLVFCGGRFAQLNGKSLISHHANLQWLQWTNREGGQQLASSDQIAQQSFSGSLLDQEIVI
jgi:hypothetical protein